MVNESDQNADRLKALDRWLEARLDGADIDPPVGLEAFAWSLLEAAENSAEREAWSPMEDTGIRAGIATALASSSRHEPGTRIGPFSIERELGAGGMGVVYLAQRVEGGFEQQVALKLLSDRYSSEDHIRQFERERQLLARLEHPGIARLIDGGITGDGQPWFAMEYVEGLALDRFVQQRQLDLSGRLDLILQLCNALDYAHSRLVLHRDIKPSNIIVDESGALKLLDFGLGRTQNPADDDQTVTQVAWRWLTPDYASPEQVRGEPITLASEVYQVGIVMYRLLCIEGPYRVRESSPAAMVEAICDTAPRSPSDYWQHLEHSDLRERASQFNSTPNSLRRHLRGDLDNIVMMALAKTPNERYRNVGELIEDIRRHLDDRPVRARAATRGYRVKKFLLRYRAAVTGTAAAFILALSALTVIALQSVQLGQERDLARAAEHRAVSEASKARQVRDYLIGLFEQASPRNDKGRDVTAYDLLQTGAGEIDELDHTPLIQAEMMLALALANRSLLDFEQAASLLDRALAVLESADDATPRDIAEVLVHRGRVAQQSGERGLADEFLQRARSLLEPQYTDTEIYALLLRNLGVSAANARDFERAENLLEQSVQAYADLQDRQNEMYTAINDLAAFYMFSGRAEQARPLFQQIADRRSSELGESHPDTVHIKTNLATALMEMGELEQAREMYRQLRVQHAELYGEESQEVSQVVYRLGRIAQAEGRLEDSETLLAEARRLRLLTRGPNDSNLATVISWQASVSRQQGKLELATEHLRDALAIYHRIVPAPHPSKLELRIALGEILTEMNAIDEATETFAVVAESLVELSDRFRGKALDGQIELVEKALAMNERDLASQALSHAESTLASSREPESFEIQAETIRRFRDLITL